MKIGFDISQIAHGGGVTTYTNNLTNQLSKMKELEMVYFYSSLRKSYKGKLKNVKTFRLPPSLFEMLFNQWRNVPIEKFIGPIDIFHSSDWTQPPTKAKKVTTYHDLVPLKFPEWSHPRIIEVHKKRLELVEKEIDIVIAVSESTKRDLLEVSNLSAEKIVVIHEAAGDNFKPQDGEKIIEFRKRLNLPEKFVLAIGGVGERRNLKAVKEAAKGYNLVITGQTIPYLSYEDLPLLYSSASVLLYPSFYEGFGLPILEAMSCGTPVITSNVSSMPEVGGDAALYVDPKDTEDIKEKLREVMENENLALDLTKKGLKQASKFSWEKCAHETVNVYKKLMTQ